MWVFQGLGVRREHLKQRAAPEFDGGNADVITPLPEPLPPTPAELPDFDAVRSDVIALHKKDPENGEQQATN